MEQNYFEKNIHGHTVIVVTLYSFDLKPNLLCKYISYFIRIFYISFMYLIISRLNYP